MPFRLVFDRTGHPLHEEINRGEIKKRSRNRRVRPASPQHHSRYAARRHAA
jgi:hypothetical protein